MYIHKNLPIILFSLFFIFIKVTVSNQIIFSALVVLLIFFLLKSDNYTQKTSILLYIFVIEFLMDPIPKDVSIYTVLFVIILIWLICKSLFNSKSKGLLVDESLLIFILMFLVFCFYFFTSSIILGVSLSNVLNAILPFCLILIFMFVYNLLIYKKLSLEKILFSLVIWGMLYSLNSIGLFLYNYIIENNTIRRITLLEFNTLSPVPLLLCVISMYLILNSNKELILFKKNTWFLIMLISFSGMLVTQTRSMIVAVIITLLMIFAYNIINKNMASVKTMIFWGSGAFSILYIAISISEPIKSIFESIMFRFESIGGSDGNVTARFDEYNAAFQVISESPFLGGGAGLEFSERASNMVNYIHNFPLYIMVNFGLIGFGLALMMFVFISYLIIRTKNAIAVAIYFGLIAVCIYALFFAVFKWLSFSLIIAITLSIALYINNKSRYLND